MTNFFRSLFKFVASLKLAVILLVMLASILAAATYYESVYDTKTAQHLVYHSSYFACFLGLLFVNVFCSTLSRYPWKRHQVGFVVTHVGNIRSCRLLMIRSSAPDAHSVIVSTPTSSRTSSPHASGFDRRMSCSLPLR